MVDVQWELVRETDPGLLAAWDDLAVVLERPYCAPGWMLGWRAARRQDSQPRIGVVRDGQRIIGVMPFSWRRSLSGESAEYDLLGSGTSYRIEPLAAPGERAAVATATCELLGSLTPPVSVLSLHGLDAASGWGEAIARAWPSDGGARLKRRRTLPAPLVSVAEVEDFEAWLATKSPNFRSDVRRARRRFLRVGELGVAATPGELAAAIEAFTALHLGRWRSRGRSNLDYPSMSAKLGAAAERLGPERLRAVTATVDRSVIGVAIFVRAATTTAYWNGGWDESFRELRPGWLTVLRGIDDAIRSGVDEIDLGPGAHPYKLRLATGDAPLVSDQVFVPHPASA